MRFTQLDVLRATAVFAVVICHIKPTSGNPLLTFNWVLQYLSIISGVTMAMGPNNPCDSSWRLFLIFVFGCGLNGIPIGLRYAFGQGLFQRVFPEENKEVENLIIAVVYQFWYVLVLLFSICFIGPLKFALKSRRGILVYGSMALCFTIAFAVCAIFSSNPAVSGDDGVHDIPLYVAHMCGAFVIVCLAEAVRSYWGVQRNSESYLGWALMVYIVLLVIAFETFFFAKFFMYPQLMLLGFTLYRNPLRFRENLQSFLESAWPLVILACQMLSMDLKVDPHRVVVKGVFERSRYSLTNFLFMALFAVCFAPCEGEKENSAPSWRLGDQKKMGWMYKWSLFVYVFHWALWDMLNLVLPGSESQYFMQMLMTFSLLVMAIPFYLCWRRKEYRREILLEISRENQNEVDEEKTRLDGLVVEG